MIASSLMKDIRDIYKFKEKPLGGGNFGTVRKAYRREEKSKKKHYYASSSNCTISSFLLSFIKYKVPSF